MLGVELLDALKQHRLIPAARLVVAGFTDGAIDCTEKFFVDFDVPAMRQKVQPGEQSGTLHNLVHSLDNLVHLRLDCLGTIFPDNVLQ